MDAGGRSTAGSSQNPFPHVLLLEQTGQVLLRTYHKLPISLSLSLAALARLERCYQSILIFDTHEAKQITTAEAGKLADREQPDRQVTDTLQLLHGGMVQDGRALVGSLVVKCHVISFLVLVTLFPFLSLSRYFLSCPCPQLC